MTSHPELGNVTGTKDKDYDIIWFTEACLSNVLRLETYIEDAALAGDNELADFFRKAQHESRKGAEEERSYWLSGSTRSGHTAHGRERSIDGGHQLPGLRSGRCRA